MVFDWILNNQVGFFLVLFAQYAVLMMYQEKLRDSGLGAILYLVFIVQDWLMNLVMTIWFLDPPEHISEVVTGRMKRYKRTGGYSKRGAGIELVEAWRYYFAVYLCKALNRFDKGHC